MHPIKGHNVAAALIEMYGEGLSQLLQENEQYKAKLKQVEAERDGLKRIIETGTADNERLRERVADLESSLCAARQGALRAQESGPGDGDARAAEDSDGVHEVQSEVADDVRDGTSAPAHRQLRDGASTSGPAEGSAPSITEADLVRECSIIGCKNKTTASMCAECAAAGRREDGV